MNILAIIFMSIMIPVCLIVFGLGVWRSYNNDKSLKQKELEEKTND